MDRSGRKKPRKLPEAINRWDDLVDVYPMIPAYREELANSYHNLGIFYQDRAHPIAPKTPCTSRWPFTML